MAKPAFSKTMKISASGYLYINEEIDNMLCIENSDTGELVDMRKLCTDFIGKPVKLNISYDYNFDK